MSNENLDELELRKARRPGATWGKDVLEDASDHYIWQPETLVYTDILSGHEVVRLSDANEAKTFVQDISFPSINADGSKIAFISKRNTNAFTSNYWDGGIWMTSGFDGTNLRMPIDTPTRHAIRYMYYLWSPVDPSVFYSTGQDLYTTELNLPEENLYKVTITENSESYELMLSMPTLDSGTTYAAPKTISSDGTQVLFFGTIGGIKTLVPVDIENSIVMVPGGYPGIRDWDDWWGRLTNAIGHDSYHDQFLTGSGNDIWLHFMPEDQTNTWMRMKITGTAADGGPAVIESQTPPYDWGDEFDYINCTVTNGIEEGDCDYPYRDPNCCDNNPATDCPNYFSHYTIDRWGRYGIYSNTDSPSGVATGIFDIINRVHQVEDFPTGLGAQHHDWHAWSDWSTSSSSPGDLPNQQIMIQNYKDANSQIAISTAHIPASGDYQRLARPTQSPDGTKVVWNSTFMSADEEGAGVNIYYTVAYYPYPPEITATSATGGTATIRFDWRNGIAEANPRTYTTRGWPDETTDDRPIPRETKQYRLWRSTDKTTWTPISTIDADHFTRFDFAAGWFIVGQDSYWEFTDSPGDGIFYYAVTSIENSGLESRTLSNLFSISISSGAGTGTEDTVYPISPGAVDAFTSAYDSDLHRYYNIYAKDVTTPTAIQNNRIASDPRLVKSYIDWTGNLNGTTKHVITAVDTQGNESEPLSSETTFANDLYTVTWTDDIDTEEPETGDVFQFSGGTISGAVFS